MPQKKKRSWSKVAPKLISERRKLLARCGRKAFLKPDKLQFPIVGKKSSSCKPDCQGLRAAYARARQFKHKQEAKKALIFANKVACDWIGRG